jgi:hypothetical protein
MQVVVEAQQVCQQVLLAVQVVEVQELQEQEQMEQPTLVVAEVLVKMLVLVVQVT